jgi:UDP-2-acetamido-3-amino-2,3-dideoxy-glucuronate N-acetyltransferase
VGTKLNGVQAKVHELAVIGNNFSIWDFSEVREYAEIGSNVSLGRNVYVGPGVHIGNFSRVQNNASIYEPAKIGEFVFIGPNVTLTNDKYPSTTIDGKNLKSAGTWTPEGVTLEMHVSIGAGVTLIGGVRVGSYSLIGAGAVVTSNIPSHSMAIGNPAKVIYRVGFSRERLVALTEHKFKSPISGAVFDLLEDGNLALNQA